MKSGSTREYVKKGRQLRQESEKIKRTSAAIKEDIAISGRLRRNSLVHLLVRFTEVFIRARDVIRRGIIYRRNEE